MQQEQGENYRQNYDFPSPKRQDSDKTIRWKVDPDDIIDEIVHYLRGDRFDVDAMEWKPQGYVYYFKIKAPEWVHKGLLSAENQGLVRYDKGAFYNSKTGEGAYTLFDSVSFDNFNSILSQANEKKAEGEQILVNMEKDEPQRLVNETGLRVISANLRGFLNKNIVLSNFDAEMINKIALNAGLNIVKLLYTSHDKFGIKKENLSIIVGIIDINTHATLLRAKEGFFTHHLSTTERHIEHENVTLQDKPLTQKKGFFNLFTGWGKDNN